MKADYQIGPVLMGGKVRENVEGRIRINLFGRLGVITISEKLVRGDEKVVPGMELKFYFSYLKINDDPYDYDAAAVDPSLPMSPVLVGGSVIEVNDTAIRALIMSDLGTVAVPRRWVFTDSVLETGQNVEFYISSMEIANRDYDIY